MEGWVDCTGTASYLILDAQPKGVTGHMWADASEVTKAKRGHRSYGGGCVRSNNSDSLLCYVYSYVARVMEGNEVE